MGCIEHEHCEFYVRKINCSASSWLGKCNFGNRIQKLISSRTVQIVKCLILYSAEDNVCIREIHLPPSYLLPFSRILIHLLLDLLNSLITVLFHFSHKWICKRFEKSLINLLNAYFEIYDCISQKKQRIFLDLSQTIM